MPDVILKHVPGMGRARAVAEHRAEAFSERAFIGDHVSQSRPCVIRGAVRHWPAMKNWRDRDYLKQRCGHYNVWLIASEYYLNLQRLEAAKRMMRFDQAIDHLDAPDAKPGLFVAAHTAALQADLGGLSFLTQAEPGFFYDAARFFFFRNAGTTWHFHSFDETLMSQIMGKKKIGLLKTNTPAYRSMRDLFFKEDYYDDACAFAGLDEAGLEWFSAELDEGDALYIPPLWWHGVIPTTQGLGATTAVTWRSPAHVTANTLRQMAAGEIDFVGDPNPATFQALCEVAQALGLEKELQTAWRQRI